MAFKYITLLALASIASAGLLPAAQVLHAAPAAQVLHAAPAAQYYQAAPAAQYLHAGPTAQVYHTAPTTQLLHAAPAAQVYHAAPTSQLLHAAPATQVYHTAPTAQLLHAAPTAQLLHSAPSAQVYQTAPTAQILHSAPTVHALHNAPALVKTVAQPVLTKNVEEYDPHPQYNFAYDIQDALSGDSKSQIESRDGDVVRGQYSLIDADGYKRTVDYSADPINGFNAVVNREPLFAKDAAPSIVKASPVAVAAAPLAAAPVFLKTAGPAAILKANAPYTITHH